MHLESRDLALHCCCQHSDSKFGLQEHSSCATGSWVKPEFSDLQVDQRLGLNIGLVGVACNLFTKM